MGRIIRFSQFDRYLQELQDSGRKVEGTILDANVIITLSYSPKKFHTRTYEFINDKLIKRGISLYTTVNTTQEYLEFYRRLIITEALRTAISPTSNINLPNKKKQVIRAQSTILQTRETTQGADPVFYDREIKKIREVFCSSGERGFALWKIICRKYLKTGLLNEYKSLGKLKIHYLSSYVDEQKAMFERPLTWDNAIDICTDTGAGFSDSMILNALQCTSFPFAVTLDVDLAFASLARSDIKDIVMPDELIDKNDGLKNYA